MTHAEVFLITCRKGARTFLLKRPLGLLLRKKNQPRTPNEQYFSGCHGADHGPGYLVCCSMVENKSWQTKGKWMFKANREWWVASTSKTSVNLGSNLEMVSKFASSTTSSRNSGGSLSMGKLNPLLSNAFDRRSRIFMPMSFTALHRCLTNVWRYKR